MALSTPHPYSSTLHGCGYFQTLLNAQLLPDARWEAIVQRNAGWTQGSGAAECLNNGVPFIEWSQAFTQQMIRRINKGLSEGAIRFL